MSQENLATKIKRRTSILKKRLSTEDDPTETTTNKFPKRSNIQFSQKKQVKEFMQCEENITIWGNTYEASVTKSEGSSDGSSTSRKISVDFTNSTVNTSTHEVQSMVIESEKENLVVPKISLPIAEDVQRESISYINNSSSTSNSIEMTIDMNASERKRIKKYEADNLNITNMQVDTSIINKNLLNIPAAKENKVMSPRKMIFINKYSNMSVVIKDKVLTDTSQLDDNVSVSMEDDEYVACTAPRKTMNQAVDMNISVDTKKKYNLRSRSSDEQKSLPKPTPTVFKVPELPKTIKFNPQNYESPPLKPPPIASQKQEMDELFDMMISDTPSKLCCIGSSCTPNRSAQKVVFSTARPVSLRKSKDIFREMGFMDDEEEIPVRRTIFQNESIKLDQDATIKDSRKTTFDKIKMDESVKVTQNLDMEQSPEKSTVDDKSVIKQKSFFDLEDDEVSLGVARNVQLRAINPTELEFTHKLSDKRSTMSNDTCNATNFIMELTHIDDTGGSLETTAEIQRKAARLLKNPHATLGSSSTINSPIPEDMTDDILRDVSKVQKSLNMESSVAKDEVPKSFGNSKTRVTTFKEDDMEMSGIEPTMEIVQKQPEVKPVNEKITIFEDSFETSTKNRPTTYNMKQMDMSAVNTTNALSKTLDHSVTSSLRMSKQFHVHISPREYAQKLVEKSFSENQTQTSVDDSSKKRATTYNINEMEMSGIEVTDKLSKMSPRMGESPVVNKAIKIFSDENVEDIPKKRVTTYNVNKMDITDIDNVDAVNIAKDVQKVVENKNRGTIYAHQMDVTDIEFATREATSSFPTKSSVMRLDFDAAASKDKARMTIYNANNMDVTGIEETERIKPTISSKRATTYSMDISGIESTAEFTKNIKDNHTQSTDNSSLPAKSKRVTTYADKMDVSDSEIPQEPQKSSTSINFSTLMPNNSKRATSYAANKMDVSDCEDAAVLQQKSVYEPEKPGTIQTSNSNRLTTYNNEMNISGIELTDKLPKPFIQNKLLDLNPFTSKRATTFADQMNISGCNLSNEIPNPPKYELPRTQNVVPVIKVDQNMSIEHQDAATKRTTTYHVNNMDVSGVDLGNIKDPMTLMPSIIIESPIVVSTDDEYKDSPMQKKRITTYNENKMDVSGSDKTLKMTLKPSILADSPIVISTDDEFKESPIQNKRATTYNANIMDVSGSDEMQQDTKSMPSLVLDSPIVLDECQVSPMQKKRATSHNINNMEMSYLEVEKNRLTTHYAHILNESDVDRRKTFTITNKRESLKWHNITDTDMLNMLDDESNPDFQDVSGSIRLSTESNVSRYEDAMEDFMNLTVKASPINQSMCMDVTLKSRRQSRIPSPIRDYDNMFESIIVNLRKKDREKPRLEIDEYLERMKIEPIKIPYCPQIQDGYLEGKLKELRATIKLQRDERRRQKKDIEDSQFPQIPSAKFLMKNYLECVEEEILKNIKEHEAIIAPVFPESIDFDRLLVNKFRTDAHLAKYWALNTTFWHLGNFKLTHRKMQMFTISFRSQQTLEEVVDSSIAIIFKSVMLYLNPAHRKQHSLTRKNLLLRREFHRAVNGVDNFTSLCGTSNFLFSFLDYYHERVLKAVNVVENFLTIVSKYKTVYNVSPDFSQESVTKRIFLSDDIVDIAISIEGYIEDTTISNLSIRGRSFEYKLQPNVHLKELKGLLLIELILFDTEKFLLNNTSRIELDD